MTSQSLSSRDRSAQFTARSPAPTGPQAAETGALPRWARALLWFNLVAEIVLVVTGGLVRLTGSGLGCPTWPQCVPGSYLPVRHQPQGIHKYIEFGNRTLISLVGIAAVAALIAVVVVVRRHRRPNGLIAIAALPLVGVATQAVIGGITVRTELNPATVASHMLVSMAIIAVSAYLLWRAGEPDGLARPVVRPEIRWLGWGLSVATAVVLVLGTVVTGSGPHSGDADAPARFSLDPRAMSWLHSDAVLLWFGILLAMLVALRLTAAPRATRRAALATLGVGLAQGLIGYVQYFTGLPIVAVALHMLGASVLVTAVTWLMLTLRERRQA